jgi:hypothetical protein
VALLTKIKNQNNVKVVEKMKINGSQKGINTWLWSTKPEGEEFYS